MTIRIAMIFLSVGLVFGCALTPTEFVKFDGWTPYDVELPQLAYYKEFTAEVNSIGQQDWPPVKARTEQCSTAKRYEAEMPPPVLADRGVGKVLSWERKTLCEAAKDLLEDAERAERNRQVEARLARMDANLQLEAERQAQWDRKRQKVIAKQCPKGLGDYGELLFANPYDVKGRCYSFGGGTTQILSKSSGLYRLGQSKTVYIDFQSKSAPSMVFQGFVKGVGVFSYTTVMGASMTVPSLVAADLPPENVPASAAN